MVKLARSYVFAGMEVFFYCLVLQESQQQGKHHKNTRKNVQVGEGILLPCLGHHDLHSFRVFLHDVIDEFLCDPCLVAQGADQIVASHCAAVVVCVLADGDLEADLALLEAFVKEAEVMAAVSLRG